MMSELEAVREALAGEMKAPFESTDPEDDRLFLRGEAVWEVACVDLACAKQTAHLDKAWKDKRGTIWFETSDVADMLELVEEEYGSTSAAKMRDPEIGKPPRQGIPDEVVEFPRVVELLRGYEKVVEEVAKRRGVTMFLLYDGGAGLTTIRVAIKTSFNAYDHSETMEVVQSVSKILKEAYDSVSNFKA